MTGKKNDKRAVRANFHQRTNSSDWSLTDVGPLEITGGGFWGSQENLSLYLEGAGDILQKEGMNTTVALSSLSLRTWKRVGSYHHRGETHKKYSQGELQKAKGMAVISTDLGEKWV